MHCSGRRDIYFGNSTTIVPYICVYSKCTMLISCKYTHIYREMVFRQSREWLCHSQQCICTLCTINGDAHLLWQKPYLLWQQYYPICMRVNTYICVRACANLKFYVPLIHLTYRDSNCIMVLLLQLGYRGSSKHCFTQISSIITSKGEQNQINLKHPSIFSLALLTQLFIVSFFQLEEQCKAPVTCLRTWVSHINGWPKRFKEKYANMYLSDYGSFFWVILMGLSNTKHGS